MSDFEHSYALVIGINDYINGISSLKTAASDATEIAHLLDREYHYTVTLLLDSAATLSQLRHVLETELPQKIQKGDRFLFYFAGHGIALNGEDGPEGYLVPQDAKLGNVSTYLRMSDVNKALNELSCRHFLGIFDCCFAGAFRWSSTRKAIPMELGTIHKERYDRFIQDPAWQILTSAAYDQTALDAFNLKDDRGQIGVGVHSPFARALIEALQGKADAFPPAEPGKPAGDGVMTASELYLYLRDRVEIATAERAIRQTPGIYPLKKHDKGEYIFLTPGHALNLPPAPPLDQSQNPYRGLQPFEEEHSKLFFGRTELIEKLQNFVKTHPLTVVLGASGSGKSSLVKAGLIPKLKQEKSEKWCMLSPIRPGETPFSALNNALVDARLQNIELRNPQKTLTQSIDIWAKNHPNFKLFIFIDQSEEIITLCSGENQRQEFFQQILKAINTHGDTLRVVLSLRSDFEPQVRDAGLKLVCQELNLNNTLLTKGWQSGRFIVPAMTRGELREAIEKPAEARVMYFQPYNLVEQLIDEVADMPGALPLLSFALSELYLKFLKRQQEAQSQGAIIDRVLTQEDYQELGGVILSLTRRADEEYQALFQENLAYEQVIRHVMLRMVAFGGGELGRRQVPLSELEYPPEKNSLVKDVIERFRTARLLVKGQDADGNPYVEPAHDALVRGWQKLLAWKQAEEEHLVLQRRLTPVALEWNSQQSTTLDWTANPRDRWEKFWKRKQQKKFLWDTNPRLDSLKQVLNSTDNWFNQVEAEFVRRSLQRQHSNRLRTIGLVAIGFVVLLGVAGLWYRNQMAEIENLTASSEALFASDQQLDALIEGLKVGEKLKRTIGMDNDARFRAMTALQQAVYEVRERNLLEVREGNRLEGYNSVFRVVWSPDSKMLASGSADGTIKLWNEDGQELKTLKGHSSVVLSVAWSPDGKILASGSADGTIKLWNKDGKELKTLKHSSVVLSVAWSPDGKMLVSGSADKTIKLWNKDGKELKTLKDSDSVTSISFSPDRTLLASVSGKDEKTIKLSSAVDGKELWSQKAHSDSVRSVVWSPDGKILASASIDKTVKLWSLEGKELRTIKNSSWVQSAAWSPDGKTLAWGSNDGSIKLWAVEGKELKTFTGHSDVVRSVNFSADGRMLASGSDDGTVRLWNIEGKELPRIQGRHSDKVYSVAWSPDGKMLASGSADNTIKVWSLANGGKELWNHKEGENVRSVSFSPDGQLLAWTSGLNIKLWNKNGKEITTLKGHKREVLSVSFSHDGQMLASGSEGGAIKIWNVRNGKELKTLDGHREQVRSVAWSPDGKWLVSGSIDKTIKLWSTVDGKERWTSSHGSDGWVYSVSFSPDGKMLASGSDYGIIKLWNLEGKELMRLKDRSEAVRSVAWSPDSKWLASGSNDQTVRLWNLELLDLDRVLERGCEWVRGYLEHNPNVEKIDRQLCDKK